MKSNRGIRKIFADIINSETESYESKKGRSSFFINKRNECLVDRYLFYLSTTDRRYDSIIQNLSNDFFISKTTVSELLSAKSEKIIEAKKNYNSLKKDKLKNSLKTKWPQYSWVI